ncbi:MAG: proton-conducting transporter membrane subunit, partial [Candidatus Saganbacteria bacterium]|nr:proton-conducting transporter membrane subunit [Candidatus Saganbacteria bacterium]
MILLPIIIPLIAGILILFIRGKVRWLRESIAVLATLATLIIVSFLFGKELTFSLPWIGLGIEFSLRLYIFSAFIMLAISGFAALITLYSTVYESDKPYLNQFYAYLLLTLAFANGVVLSDNLILFLFFWDALLLTLFGMIFIGGKDSFKTAIKAFIIIGVSDLFLLMGVALTGNLAGTFTMSKISLSVAGPGGIAFILLMIG